jgi:hypothetical protein
LAGVTKTGDIRRTATEVNMGTATPERMTFLKLLAKVPR